MALTPKFSLTLHEPEKNRLKRNITGLTTKIQQNKQISGILDE